MIDTDSQNAKNKTKATPHMIEKIKEPYQTQPENRKTSLGE